MKLLARLVAIVILLTGAPVCTSAHEWHSHAHGHSHTDGHSHKHHSRDDKQPITALKNVDSRKAKTLNTQPVFALAVPAKEKKVEDKPDIARSFEKFKGVKLRWNSDTLFVESNGLPDHNMMVGIRSWQQQVPLPQPFTGSNAWQIPLKPQLARKPVSAKTSLYRGAIALAVNGVPIFNALNNRGEDAYLAGELDQWGGHCGRGDDYHYHMAPVHLEKIVGKGNPIAFALDGFPIYGLTEADGSPVGKLDAYNGQFDEQGRYHYHATKTYPYINGGMRGVVTIRGDQIEPQPRDAPVRPALRPLRGATIKGFSSERNKSVLTYSVRSQVGSVTYWPVGQNSWKFIYAEPGGRTRTETYQRRQRPGPPGNGQQPPPPPRGKRPTPRR